MTAPQRIAIIGAGAMGSAFLGGLLARKIATPATIMVGEPRAERRAELAAQYGLQANPDNVAAVRGADLIIFAIKPQSIVQILAPLRGAIPPNAVCISILAGTPLRTFTTGLDHAAVVRAMPNTPAQIGAGMTVWTATRATNQPQRTAAQRVLQALGQDLYVEEESHLDMATAINGSGPAYVFLMLEAMVDTGVHMGLARPVAAQLVLQTMLGAARYAQESGQHLAQLRNAVTSPGGTTAAGLAALEEGGLRAVLSSAIWAAYQRSQALGAAQNARPRSDTDTP